MRRHLRREHARVLVGPGAQAVALPVGRLWAVAIGKAAVAMAEGLASVLPEVAGVAVAPPGGPERVGRILVVEGAHPVPDRRSFEAAELVLRRLRRRPVGDAILLLLSGGASSLLARPAPGITASDKRRLGQLLLACGADIELTNAVRKHVSSVKGGGLLRAAAPRRVLTLALSDVVSDSLATIGSGPAVPDPSTYREAWEGLEHLGVIGRLPPGVRRRLRAGLDGRASAPETVKPGSVEARRARAWVIGSNRLALRAAAREARKRGYGVLLKREPLAGEASVAGAAFVARLPKATEPLCVLAGGETTVRVGGARGRGGRNQELAVAAMRGLAGRDWSLLAAGTDGIDGQTPAAGGFADASSLQRAGSRAVARTLAEHDSHRLLVRLGDAFSPGPTGTNVMDLAIALGGPIRP